MLLLVLGTPAFADDRVQTDLYTVVDGYKVDANTMKGFAPGARPPATAATAPIRRAWSGPSLVESLKTLTKEEFVKTVTEGRLEKGMPSFSTSKTVMDNIDKLYAYLKGRSDGAITRAKVQGLK